MSAEQNPREVLLGSIEFIVDEWKQNGSCNADGALWQIADLLDEYHLAEMKERNATGGQA